MHEIGKMGGNAFTPLDRFTDLDDEARMSQAEQHPAFGFKCDLIRLIASLVHLSSSNQDLVSCYEASRNPLQYWDTFS